MSVYENSLAASPSIIGIIGVFKMHGYKYFSKNEFKLCLNFHSF